MKIAIVSTVDFVPWQFRSEFIATLVYNGHEVTVISSEGPYVERLKAIGAEHVAIPLNRFIDPIGDFLYLFRLYRTFRKLKPDIVYAMTAKPMFIGPVIAKAAGHPHVYSIFGGIGFYNSTGGSIFTRFIKWLAQSCLRLGIKFTDGFVFQNNEDWEIFIKNKLVTIQNSIVVSGSGVNLNEFSTKRVNQKNVADIRQEFGVTDSGILIIMVSRVSKSKGVLEYIEASRKFSDLTGQIKFVHVGSREKGSLDGIAEDQLEETLLFKQAGFRTNIREIVAAADIVVLPSYHREGVPNSLLEGLAMKKPIVTTDNVGCREVVDDGSNGFLVPVRDPTALADAIRKLVNDPVLRTKMGEASYEKAKSRFTVESVNKLILEDLFKLENVRIPEFFTTEHDGKLVISLDGREKTIDVAIIQNDHVLTR